MERIVWRGNFDLSGFGRAAIDYVAALKKLNVDVKVVDTSIPRLRLVNLPLNVEQLEISKHKESDILIQHAPPFDFKSTDAAINIGYTTFESPRIPELWVEKIALLDGLMVPSSWNKKILIEAGVPATKVHVVPHIVNYVELDVGAIKPFMIRNKKKFSFLSIIDFNYRKGWDALLEAYWTEFRKDEDVSLILKTYHRGFGKNDRERVEEYINDFRKSLKLEEIPHTAIYNWPLHDSLLPSLYRTCNAYVFPTRGEGFSLTCAEALALEVPVIVTDYGGHTDYVNYSNSTLIKYKGLEPLSDDKLGLSPQYKGLPLAEPSIEHLRYSMRQVYIYYDEMKEKAKKGRIDVKSKFSQMQVGETLLDTIERIAHR